MSQDPEIDTTINEADDEVKNIMVEHDVDADTAERAQELIDEGLDESDAVELAEEGV